MAITGLADSDELNSIIKRSLIGFGSKENIEVITKKSTVNVSNTITSLQNAFNQIYAYTVNVKNIHTSEEKRLKNIKKEVTIESRAGSASLAASPSIDMGNLPDIFKQLTDSIEGLTKNLDNLNMSSTGGSASIVGNTRPPPRAGRGGLGMAVGGLGLAVAGAGIVASAGPLMEFGGRAASAIGGFFGNSAGRANTNRDATRPLETAAANVTRQGRNLERAPPIGSAAPSSRFADYMNQTITNMSAWAVTANRYSAAAGAVGSSTLGNEGGGEQTLSGETRADFQSIMAMAAAAGAPHPEIVAAQWALESGWGSRISGRNNPFGQKARADEPATDRSTTEYINGRYVNVTDRFKDYETLDAAIADHVRRWNARYTTAGTTPFEAIQAIQSRGYATDPNYVTKISRILSGQNIDPRRSYTYRAPTSGTVARSGARARRLTGAFGERRPGHSHGGIDIPGTRGEPIASLQSGSVIFAGMGTPGSGYNNYGNVVHIRQLNGYDALYAHLHRITPGIRQGTRVEAAQIIGELGSTGRSSGNHLHFEIRRGNTKLDPTAVYNSNPWIVGGAPTITPVVARQPAARSGDVPSVFNNTPFVFSSQGSSQNQRSRTGQTHQSTFEWAQGLGSR